MLKNLTEIVKNKKANSDNVYVPYIDSKVACQIIDIMFDQINRCIQQDRSKIKVNLLAKGIIQGLLGTKTKDSMKDYLVNMYPEDIKNLLDSVQSELNKRVYE